MDMSGRKQEELADEVGPKLLRKMGGNEKQGHIYNIKKFVNLGNTWSFHAVCYNRAFNPK